MSRDEGRSKGTGGVDGGVGIAGGKQVAGEEGESNGEGCHEGGFGAFFGRHEVDEAQNGGQPKFEEETTGQRFSVVLFSNVV